MEQVRLRSTKKIVMLILEKIKQARTIKSKENNGGKNYVFEW